jgi:hypothetical protein
MPDGTTARFPDGTPPEVIEKVRREKAAALQRQAEASGRTGFLPTAIQAFGQGFTYGGADEPIAGIESAAGVMPYQQSLASQAAEREAMRRANPLTYGVSELVGAVLSPNPVGKAGAVGSAYARLGREAAIGGGIGAAQGALEAQPGERLSGAVTGGALGAVAAPAVGAAGSFVRGGSAVMGRAFNPNEPRVAAQQVLGAVRESKTNIPRLESDVALTSPGETVPFGMRLGMPGQLATERAGIGGGEAANITREASQDILSGSGARVMGIVNEMTGGNRQFAQDILDKLEAARNMNASELYGKARAVGIVPDQEVVEMIARDPLTRSLYKQAQTNALRQENLKLPDLFDKEGNLIANAYPSVASLDYLLRALRAKKDKAFRAGDVNASGINALFKSLDEKVKGLVPEYRDARAKFADDSELIKLSELGKQFVNMPQSQRQVTLRGLSPEKLEVVRATARDTLYNNLASANDAGLARMLTSTKQNRDLLDFLAVTPEQAAQAALRIKQERQLQEFARNINPNIGSRTARTQAAAGQGVDQLAAAEQAMQFAAGGPEGRVMTLLNLAGGRLRGLTPDARADMARMLVQTDPEQQAQILSRLKMEDQLLMREELERARRRLMDVQFGAKVPGLLSTED